MGRTSKGIVVCENIIKSLVHYSIMIPTLSVIFLGGTAFFKNFDIYEAKENVGERFKHIIKISSCVWPFVYFWMYHGIPPAFRNLVLDITNFSWNIILSYYNNT